MDDPQEPPLSLWLRLGELWFAYLKGQLVLALILGALTWVVSAGIGLSWAFPLGLTAGLLSTIPSIGPILALIPAAVVALWKGSSVIPVENWQFALITAGVYLLIQQTSSLVLEPRILGSRLNLPPWIVFLGVVAGALVGGVVGAYLAAPVLASVREIIQHFRGERPTA